MVVSKHLRIAFLISFIWHIFWMSSVSVIFVQTGIKPEQHAAVNFLGSILFSVKEIPSKPERFVQLPVEAIVQKKSPFGDAPSRSLLDEKVAFNPDSIINVDDSIEQKLFAEHIAIAKDISDKQEIIFKPKLAKYPEWKHQQFLGNPVVFKVYVSTEGLVQEVTNLQSSGHPEIDTVLARYLKQWRFAPKGLKNNGQWQTIKLNLELDEIR